MLNAYTFSFLFKKTLLLFWLKTDKIKNFRKKLKIEFNQKSFKPTTSSVLKMQKKDCFSPTFAAKSCTSVKMVKNEIC